MKYNELTTEREKQIYLDAFYAGMSTGKTIEKRRSAKQDYEQSEAELLERQEA